MGEHAGKETRMLIGPNQATCSVHDRDAVRRHRREQVIRSVACRLDVPPAEVGVSTHRDGDKIVFTGLWLPKTTT